MTATDQIKTLFTPVNKANRFVRNVWIIFILFVTYLTVAIAATTHKDLLLENPVTLPLLSGRISLFTFFVAAPFLVLIFHFYLLALFVQLASKLSRARAETPPRSESSSGDQRISFPQTVDVKAGWRRIAQPQRLTVLAFFLTVFWAPALLLLAFQLRFLPYHSIAMTMTHRAFLLADVVTLGWAWLLVVGSWMERPFKRAVAWITAILPATAFLAFAGLVATIPDEPIETWLLQRSWLKTAPRPWAIVYREGRMVWWITAKLFEIKLDPDTRTASNWLSRNYLLVAADLTDEETAKYGTTLSLRGRDLRYSVLPWANLRKADLFGAQLQGADLRGAQLQDADLERTQLQGARLEGARLDSARLQRANLEGAWLSKAQLRSGRLDDTNLQGAGLDHARLQGASLNRAQLQGAWLAGAQLQGAELWRAQLQGAWLNSAQMQGAWLEDAQLQGAELGRTQLQGAWLKGAKLQGARLEGAQLQGASLQRAGLWRAKPPLPGAAHLADLRAAHFEPVVLQRVEEQIAEHIPDEALRSTIFKSLESRLDTPSKEEDESWQELWRDLDRQSGTDDQDYGEKLAAYLGEIACAPKDAPHVAVGISHRIVGESLHQPYSPILIALLLDPACVGVPDALKAELRRRAGEAP